jgi:UDP-N-acetylglucosamine 2-epimerase (non-hydrolysing)
MKVLTVLGTRPEIIRLSLVVEMLDRLVDHTLVHTGQNYDDRLDGLFFREMGVRAPDVQLGARGAGFGELVGQILAGIEPVLHERRPDRVLILGDTNSGLIAMVARRMGIPVYHMEAGNRCYDDRVPEEVNRRIIDHSSTVLMPYTMRSRENLLAEGIPGSRIYVTGNPIKQVIDRHRDRVAASGIHEQLGVEPGAYFLVTMHRAENVDQPDRLRGLIEGLRRLHGEYHYPVICSLHPRTRSKAGRFGIDLDASGLRFVEPFGFFDFLRLEQDAFCVISDSGTVQEETCIFGVPNVTIREVTERPETVECGSNLLVGTDPEAIVRGVATVTARAPDWAPPPEYLQDNVAEVVCNIVTGFRLPDAAEMEWRAGAPRPPSG